MKKLLNILLLAVILLMIALVPGCGTRKSGLNKSTTENTNISNTELNQTTQKESGITTQDEAFNQTAKTNETTTTTKTTYLDDQGRPTKTEEKTEIGKSTDNSFERRKTITTSYFRLLEKLKIKNNTKTVIKTYTKIKTVTTNRNGQFWLIGIVLIVGLAMWLKPWK